MGPQNVDQKLDEFLSISCFSMKMTLRNLCVVTQDETWVHQFDTEAKQSEYAMEAHLLTCC